MSKAQESCQTPVYNMAYIQNLHQIKSSLLKVFECSLSEKSLRCINDTRLQCYSWVLKSGKMKNKVFIVCCHFYPIENKGKNIQLRIPNWSNFKLIISDQVTNNIELNFCLNMCSIFSKSLAVSEISCFSIHDYFR